MSIITIQVGQCGNQVGYNLFNTIHDDCYMSNVIDKDSEYIDESTERFFYRTNSDQLEARGIQIDMEEKVICNQIVNTNWKYAEKGKYVQKHGSGNNWANGYCKNGPKVLKKIDELLRFQLERADSIDGILITMSVAGGTGSGVGTLLTRFIKENYPNKTLVNHLVWPYKQGEVSVQSYNALLSVTNILGQNNGVMDSTLSSDAIIIHENDLLHSICLNRLGLSTIGVNELNNLICHQLASVLQPVTQTRLPLSSLVLANVIHPDYRLLKMRNVPYINDKCIEFTTDTWKQLLKQMNQMILTGSVLEEGLDWTVKFTNKRSSNIASHVILRGYGCDTFDKNSIPFGDRRLYSTFLTSKNYMEVWSNPRPFNLYEKSITTLVNGQDSVSALNCTTSKAWSMFNTDAFLYQYERYGLKRTHFLDCFANTEQIIHNYMVL